MTTNKKKKLKVIKGDFAEFANITYDCPGRDYGSYKWDNKKKKWLKSKF